MRTGFGSQNITKNIFADDSTTTTCHSPVYLGGGFADGLYDLVEW